MQIEYEIAAFGLEPMHSKNEINAYSHETIT